MQRGDTARFERASRDLRVPCRVDAFGKTKSHQQKLIGDFRGREHFVGGYAVAFFFHPREPAFRTLFGGGGVVLAGDIEPAVRAGPDAGLFLGAPIDEVVPAFAARPGVI